MNPAMPRKLLDRLRFSEHGQGLVEYALIIAAVAIVIIAVLAWLGQVVFVNLYSKIGSSVQNW